MSDTSFSDPSSLYDPGDIQARLDALVGHAEASGNNESQECAEPDLQEVFLADPTIDYLASRNTTVGDDGGEYETLIEYHRITTEPNQTRLILHIAFRPDFCSVPTANVSLLDIDGRARVTQTAVFGARIEITLANKADSRSSFALEAIFTTFDENES